MENAAPDPSVVTAALATLAREVLAHPSKRKSFVADPEGTLQQVGVNPADLSQDLLDTLSDMSYEELEVLSRVDAALARAGVAVEPGGDTQGIII